eukprot:scpid107591/ scgid6906/ 
MARKQRRFASMSTGGGGEAYREYVRKLILARQEACHRGAEPVKKTVPCSRSAGGEKRRQKKFRHRPGPEALRLIRRREYQKGAKRRVPSQQQLATRLKDLELGRRIRGERG